MYMLIGIEQNRTTFYFQMCRFYMIIMHSIYIQTNKSLIANKHKEKERKGKREKKEKRKISKIYSAQL